MLMTVSLLKQAIKGQNPEEALRLFRSGEDRTSSENGRSNLQRAIKWCPDNLELIQELLKNRNVVNFVDRDGNNAMITAAHRANAAVIELLIDAKADVHCEDKWGRGPLYHAAIYSAFCLGKEKRADFYPQTLDAMRTLVRHGAEATCPYPKSSMLAVYLKSWETTGDLNAVSFLVVAGAPPLSLDYLTEHCRKVCMINGDLAMKAGWQERQKQWKTVKKMLDSLLPGVLIPLVCNYLYIPINRPSTTPLTTTPLQTSTSSTPFHLRS